MIDAPSDEDDEALILFPPRTTHSSLLSQVNGEITLAVQTPISSPKLNIMTPQSRSAFEPYCLHRRNDPNSAIHGSSARTPLARSLDPSQSSPFVPTRFPPASPRTPLAQRVTSSREDHVETAGTLHSCASDSAIKESAPIRRLHRGGSERYDYIGKRPYDPTAVAPRGRNRAHSLTTGFFDRSQECISFGRHSNGSEDSIFHASPPSRPRRATSIDINSSIGNTRSDSDTLSLSTVDDDEIRDEMESHPIHPHAPLHQRDGSTGQPTIMTASSTAPTTRFDRFTSWRGVFGMLTVSLNRHNDRATLPRRRTMKVLACIGLYFISICTFLHLPLRNGPFFPSFGSRKLSKPSRKKDVFQFNEDEIGNEKTAGLGFGVGHGREVAFPLAGRVSEESGSDDIKDGAPTSSKKLKAFVFKRKDTTTSIDNFSDHHEYEAYDSSSASGGIGNAPSTSSEIHKSGGRRPSLSHAKASSNEMVFGVSSREVRLTPNGSESNGASGSPKQAVKRFIPPENGARNRMKSEHTSRGWDWSNALRALYKALAWVGFMVLVLETGYQEMTRRFMYLRQRRIRPRTE
mmetsp:Transcript_31012/g.45158  ORF Transcript_31012/g.45158 Transcript_31012/m.45158 type:complete len:575 (+) Transcript_31012:152-1876(+)